MPLSSSSTDTHAISAEDLLGYDGDSFVEMLYRVVLGRLPDEAGFARHLNDLLVQGHTKEQLFAAFLNSDEYKASHLNGNSSPDPASDESAEPVSRSHAEIDTLLSTKLNRDEFVRSEQRLEVEHARLKTALAGKADREELALIERQRVAEWDQVHSTLARLIDANQPERVRQQTLADRESLKAALARKTGGRSGGWEPWRSLCPPIEPDRRTYTVNELCAFDGAEFVVNAYRCLLKREPDDVGFSNYLSIVTSALDGRSIALCCLADAAEAATVGVKVSGMPGLRWRVRLMRLPVVGPLIRYALLLRALPQPFLQLRRLQVELQSFVSGHDSSVRVLTEELAEVAAGGLQKADRWEVESMMSAGRDAVVRLETQQSTDRQDLAAALSRKADSEELAHMEGRFATQRLQMAEALGRKADATLLDEIRRKKANCDLVNRLQATKADGEALDSLERRYLALTAQVDRSGEILADMERQIDLLFDALSRRPAEISSEAPELHAGMEPAGWRGSLYAFFEDTFRGTNEEIKARQSIYVPRLQACLTPGAQYPVLDIGCGRGEWLELLREHGLPATGVDSNRTMIQRCLERGLNVIEADGLEYLRSLRPRSLMAITAFHVVEHLPMPKLLSFLGQAFRVLRPGGHLILETPNPANLIVGSCNFWIDPTHIRPLPSPLLRFLVQSKGFENVEVDNLHPEQDRVPLAGSDLAETINQYLYGPRDYAVLASKPMAVHAEAIENTTLPAEASTRS